MSRCHDTPLPGSVSRFWTTQFNHCGQVEEYR